MLREIHIKELFGIFDYSIRLNKEGITILTGPNGYGKTTILKIIHAIARKNILFLLELSFTQISLIYDDRSFNTSIKKRRKDDNDEFLTIKQGGIKLGNASKNELLKKYKPRLKKIYSGYISEGFELRLDRNKRIYDYNELSEPIDQLSLFDENFQLPTVPEVYLIREQRLLKQAEKTTKGLFEEDAVNYFDETIKEYAKELKEYIADTLSSYSQITQQLDSSFPKRLFDEQDEIPENTFNIRFEKIKNLQKALYRYGLSVTQEDNHPTYKQENAKALAVYLADTEKKLNVFKDLLRKLELFTSILNERRFIFKEIHVSKEEGFRFLTKSNQHLPLTELSSGEQQEVVLLFELLFKVKPGTLVLIDEPEISLHVAWQKEFLNDLTKITELQKINTIIATHSPQIINDRWDLTVDLEELIHETIS